MKLSFEKLVPDAGSSFRCFDRRSLTAPVKWHSHPEIELTYVEKGSGARVVGDHIGEYSDHDLVLLGSGLPHTWTSDEYRGQEYDLHGAIVIQFHPDFLGKEFFDAPELERISHLIDAAARGLWFPAREARMIGWRMKDLVDQAGVKRLLGLLACLEQLTLSTEAKSLASKGYMRPGSKEVSTRIQIVCDHIQSRFTDPRLSAHDLSELLLMNASAFSRFFKQATGRTPSGYINTLRIGYACRQLIDSDKGILEICHDSGFTSNSYFNRTFRTIRRMTPREYREKHARLRVENEGSNGK